MNKKKKAKSKIDQAMNKESKNLNEIRKTHKQRINERN